MSIETKLDLSGFSIASLEVRKAIEQGIKDSAYNLQELSTDEAPIMHGDLRDSANASFETIGNDYTAVVSYSAVYAARQHEHPEYNHPKGGKGKYLEDPFKKNMDRYLEYIRNMIKAALK